MEVALLERTDEILNRGIMAIIRRILEKHYPLALALLVPINTFLGIIEGTVKAIPESDKWSGIRAVKENVDALAALYTRKWMRAQVFPTEKDKFEVDRLEGELRKLGLLG